MFTDAFPDIDNYSTDPDKYLAVPFVPTEEEVVEAMLNLVNAGPNDLIYDLGSGDGRILVTAARDRDARGVGIDIDPMRIADAMEFAGWSGVEYLVDFIEDDIFTAEFSKATIVTLYLLQSINLELRPRLLSELRPGTRIVSHAFDMGDWEADERLKVNGVNVYKWVVPARVEGVWEWQRSDGKTYRVDLQQKFQKITGSAWLDDEEIRLHSAGLDGNRLELEFQDDEAAPVNAVTLTFAGGKIKSVVEDKQSASARSS